MRAFILYVRIYICFFFYLYIRVCIFFFVYRREYIYVRVYIIFFFEVCGSILVGVVLFIYGCL